MKKNKITIMHALMLCLSMASCQKFLDVKKSSKQAIIATAKDCQLLLDNYSINTGYPSDGEASADDYFFGIQSVSVPQEEKDIYSWAANGIRLGSGQWTATYSKIYTTNLVLETLAEIHDGTDQTLLNTLKGSALFLRSYNFWQTTQLYTKPYSAATAGSDLGIPLRLASDISTKSSRNTLAETYSRIVQDLQEAVTLLPPTSEKPTRPNKAAAYAMLARVYLSMGDYPQALIHANAALDINKQLINYSTLSTSSSTPFLPRFNKEVIFHSLMIAHDALKTNDIARINQDLVASYQSNDLRKTVLLKQNNSAVKVANTPGSTDSTTITVPDGTYRFTGNYEPSITVFFNGLTVDEMYLISAECYARAGNVSASMAALNTLLVTRWVPGTYVNKNAVTADEAVTMVLAERRKSLLMRGLRWTDDKRLGLSLTRKTVNIVGKSSGSISGGYTVAFTYPATATYTLPAGDPRFTLLIPQDVINNSSLQQNQR